MTGLQDFLRRLTILLDSANVPYMITGSIASTFHGAPRATQDIDVIVELTQDGLASLLSSLDDEAYYVSPEAARTALRTQSLFNLIDIATGWKADLIVKKLRDFSRVEFQRRERAVVLGVPIWVTSAEDSIISKLEWSQLGGGSERQLRDVSGILDLKRTDLDRPYVERWCDELEIRELWESLQTDSDPHDPTPR